MTPPPLASIQAIMPVDNVLVCVICEKTSKSKDPGNTEILLDFPRKMTCRYCLWYYINMYAHVEWAVYSAAFTEVNSASKSFVLVDEVKAHLEEMYKEVASGKMTIPNLNKSSSFDFTNDESRVACLEIEIVLDVFATMWL